MSESPELRDLLVAMLPRLRRFARALAKNADDADDIVQIAVERALLHLHQWRRDTKLESWVFGIIRNAWIDEVRGRARRGRVFVPEEAGAHVGEALMESHIQVTSIQEAMALLPEEQCVVVALVLIEGLSYQEAAGVVGVPIGTVTSRLARGREALQKILDLEPRRAL
jgi:RNA polymerase sigma-70 factor, ECF subfamily